MDTITAEQRAELVRQYRGDPSIAAAIEQCGRNNGEDCPVCASLYEMEFEDD